ncbi:MAG: hypothetical protein ACYDC3_08005 [Candidatus Binataceae bacterium]
MGFLIDTCVWIDVERGNLAPADVDALTASEEIFQHSFGFLTRNRKDFDDIPGLWPATIWPHSSAIVSGFPFE